MMKAILFLGLALVVAQAAPQGDPASTLKGQADLFRSIADSAGALDELASDKARVTVLAPSDEAVKAFLKDMGLTAEDVKKNHNLARALVAYHTVLGVAAGPKELFAKGKTVEIATADPHYSVTFLEKPTGVFVKDFQGNEAKVSKASLGVGKHTVHVIDKVLYSGSYFKDLAAVIKAYPNLFSTVAAAATKAGLADKLTKQSFAETIFLPTNAAFKKEGIDLAKTDKATLEKVLTYHVVPTARFIPDGFTSGKALGTLNKGADITVITKDDPEASKVAGLKARRAYVTDGAGDTAMVIKPNLQVGPAVAHVIDGVLTPKAAAVSTEAGAKTTAAAKTTVAAAPAPKAATTGRKLLQRGGGGGRGGNAELRGQYSGTIGLDSTEQAIQIAVNSASNAGAVRGAANAGVTNSELGSIYGEHSTYADGVKGSYPGFGAGGN